MSVFYQSFKLFIKELICHNKFRLALLSNRGIGGSGALDLASFRKNFNVVNFEYSSEALDQKLLRKVMFKVDPDYCCKFESGISRIRELEGIVAERKEKVGITLKAVGMVSLIRSI
jgi:hypothetical protein